MSSLFRFFVELIQSSCHASSVSDYFPPFGLLVIASSNTHHHNHRHRDFKDGAVVKHFLFYTVGDTLCVLQSISSKNCKCVLYQVAECWVAVERLHGQGRAGAPGSEGQGVAYPILSSCPSILFRFRWGWLFLISSWLAIRRCC